MRGATGEGGEDRTPARAWLLGILLVALVLRLVWALYAARNPVGLNDPSVYLSQARTLSEGHGYRAIDGPPTAYYPVGYPAMLGAVTWVVNHTPLGNVPRTAAVFQALLGTFSVWLVWRCASALFAARTALVAAAIVAVFPGLLLYSATLLSETLFITLELAALAVLLAVPWGRDGPSWRRLAAFGALVGLAALVRPQALVLVPAVALALAVTRSGWRRSLVAGGVALLAAVLVILPWTVRNAVVMDGFVPISTNGGDDLCIGHNELATGRFAFFPACADIRGKTGPEREIAREKKNTRAAVQFLLHHPGSEPSLLAKKLYYLYQADHGAIIAAESFGQNPFMSASVRDRLKKLSDLYFFGVLVLAIAGMALIATRRDARRAMLVIGTLAMALVPLVFFGDMRFHVPASPLFAIAAAVALTRLADRLRERRGARRTAPA